MKNNFLKESIVAVVLVVLLVVLANPNDILMPTMAQVTMLAVTLAAFALYASYILREKAIDERDVLHRMFASRAAYLVGSSLLIVGIVHGAWKDELDLWLIATLVAMILTKLAARFYSDRNL